MRTNRGFQTWCYVVVAIAVLAPLPDGGCQLLTCYDLDSMVLLSSGIVEGEIVPSLERSQREFHELKVDRVYKGPFEEGDTVKIDLGIYRKHTADRSLLGKLVPLDNHDRVVVFLSGDRLRQEDPDLYLPVSLGVRFIAKGKAIHFRQEENPGPVVLQDSEDSSKYWIDAEELRKDISESIVRVEAIGKKLDADLEEKDAAWLMKLIDERPGKAPGCPYHEDLISRLACAKIAQFKNPQISMEALEHANTWSKGQDVIRKSFGTPKGREFLLKVISDSGQPMEKRITCAQTLRSAGATYHLTFHVTFRAEKGSYSLITDGSPKDKNGTYLSRIAQLALDNAKNEELRGILLDTMSGFAREVSRREEPHTCADMLSAVSVLEKLYGSTQSEQARFDIELAAAFMDRSRLEKLNADCGPIITMITELELRRQSEGERCVSFSFSACDFARRPIKLSPYLVLQNAKSGDEHHLSFKGNAWNSTESIRTRDAVHSFDGNKSVRMGRMLVLPEELPGGRYRVYIEYRDGEKVVSKGHYREIDL